MIKNAERNLSFTLALTSIFVFILTLVGVFFNNVFVALIWNVVFLICWLLMVVFGFVVLFDKHPYKFSILVAILTSLAFIALSAHAIVILARFVPQLPDRIVLPNAYLVKYNQVIFYTTLIVVYFIHFINYAKLSPTRIGRKLIKKAKEDTKKVKDFVKEEVSEEDLAILNSHLEDASDSLFENEASKDGQIENKDGLEE